MNQRYFATLQHDRVLWKAEVDVFGRSGFWVGGKPTFFGITRHHAEAKAARWVRRRVRRDASRIEVRLP